MSLLSICNTVTGEIGLPTFNSIVGNVDLQATQLLYLANRAGNEIATDSRAAGYWQQLRKQYVFTTSGVGPYTCTITPGSASLTNLSSTTGIVLGQSVYASGLVNDTLVTDVSQLGSGIVGISQVPTASSTLSGQSVVFATEAYSLPSDFQYMINQTEWDRTFRWQLLGPLDAQEWQVIKSGISPVGPRMRFRIMGGMFYVNPVGSAATVYNNTIAFEYVSNGWVKSVGGSAQTSFLADTDTAIIPEDLITLYTKALFLQAKGLEYAPAYKIYQDKLDRTIGRSAAARNLPINARASGINLLGWNNIPDTGYGS